MRSSIRDKLLLISFVLIMHQRQALASADIFETTDQPAHSKGKANLKVKHAVAQLGHYSYQAKQDSRHHHSPPPDPPLQWLQTRLLLAQPSHAARNIIRKGGGSMCIQWTIACFQQIKRQKPKLTIFIYVTHKQILLSTPLPGIIPLESKTQKSTEKFRCNSHNTTRKKKFQ